MYIVARNIRETFSKPITFALHKGDAETALGAPAQLKDLAIMHPEYCREDKPTICKSLNHANELLVKAENLFLKLHASLPIKASLSGIMPYPLNILHRTDGSIAIMTRVYVVRRALPIGRNKTEALNDPLSHWPIGKINPVLEGKNLTIKQYIIKTKFEKKTEIETNYARQIEHGFINITGDINNYHPELTYLKAPRHTYARDINRQKNENKHDQMHQRENSP